jgi:hypothetical protein
VNYISLPLWTALLRPLLRLRQGCRTRTGDFEEENEGRPLQALFGDWMADDIDNALIGPMRRRRVQELQGHNPNHASWCFLKTQNFFGDANPGEGGLQAMRGINLAGRHERPPSSGHVRPVLMPDEGLDDGLLALFASICAAAIFTLLHCLRHYLRQYL